MVQRQPHQNRDQRQQAAPHGRGHRAPRPGLRQRGVAVITALLLTTLAVAIVASLFWQQQVQVRSMENQRLHLQTKWILLGALDFSRLVLQQDAQINKVTALDGIWATPVAETRLDQYIERERVEGESFDATVSGHITDAQSRYNLTNLSKDRILNSDQLGMFRHLLQNLQIDPGLAMKVAQAVQNTQSPPPEGSGMVGGKDKKPNPTGPIEMMQVDDLLAIPGVSQETVEKLRKFVVVLPAGANVNVNTAPPEVLAMLAPELTMADANVLVAKRKQAHFKDIGGFQLHVNDLGGTRTLVADSFDVQSSFFLVSSKVKLDRAALDSEALMQRRNSEGGQTRIVWIRQN
jgi:general secretion pathway protein K